MKAKQFILDEQLTISVTKRASSRSIRLTIGSDGQVKASIPRWLPYSDAVSFARSKLDWIKSKRTTPQVLRPGRRVGKNHQLIFKQADKETITTRLSELEATVFYPKNMSINDPKVQAAAKKVIRRALLSQAKRLLPIRLRELAQKHDYSYSEVKIKSLKTRWGSCDMHKNITLNLYLMELPWDLIDYVILHELNHTEIMQHGPKFWDALRMRMPNCMERRTQLKSYSTIV